MPWANSLIRGQQNKAGFCWTSTRQAPKVRLETGEHRWHQIHIHIWITDLIQSTFRHVFKRLEETRHPVLHAKYYSQWSLALCKETRKGRCGTQFRLLWHNHSSQIVVHAVKIIWSEHQKYFSAQYRFQMQAYTDPDLSRSCWSKLSHLYTLTRIYIHFMSSFSHHRKGCCLTN